MGSLKIKLPHNKETCGCRLDEILSKVLNINTKQFCKGLNDDFFHRLYTLKHIIAKCSQYFFRVSDKEKQ